MFREFRPRDGADENRIVGRPLSQFFRQVTQRVEPQSVPHLMHDDALEFTSRYHRVQVLSVHPDVTHNRERVAITLLANLGIRERTPVMIDLQEGNEEQEIVVSLIERWFANEAIIRRRGELEVAHVF
jgi:hypothetical protein